MYCGKGSDGPWMAPAAHSPGGSGVGKLWIDCSLAGPPSSPKGGGVGVRPGARP